MLLEIFWNPELMVQCELNANTRDIHPDYYLMKEASGNQTITALSEEAETSNGGDQMDGDALHIEGHHKHTPSPTTSPRATSLPTLQTAVRVDVQEETSDSVSAKELDRKIMKHLQDRATEWWVELCNVYTCSECD